MNCSLPGAPTNLNVTQIGASVTFTWQPPSGGGVTSYVLHVGSTPGAADLQVLDVGATHQARRLGSARHVLRAHSGQKRLRVQRKRLQRSRRDHPVIRSLLVSILVTLGAHTAAAQVAEPLFVHRVAIAADAVQAPMSGRAEVVSRAQVGVQIDRLFGSPGAASRVLLNTGDQTWTARFERVDTDAAGFRSWVGAIDGISDSHVVFTERNGVLSGLINAGGTTYQVRTEGSGSYLLERIDVTRLGDERDPITAPDQPRPSLEAETLVADDGGTIDVLMLYTPSARAQRGGTESIESLVSQIISDTNTALARSGVITRVRLVAAREIPIIESAAMGTDLTTLRTQAEPLRDQLHADLVQLLVHSPDLSTCGVGYLLDSFTFTNFPAYSVADIACAAQYTPTHEMAHNMGSNHAPEDGASGGAVCLLQRLQRPGSRLPHDHGLRVLCRLLSSHPELLQPAHDVLR